MTDFIYEVRFPNNPDKSFTQKFSSKSEAINCSNDFPGSEVYMLELYYDDEYGTRGVGELVDEIQIKGPEVNANLVDPNIPNSCEADVTENLVEVDEVELRLPKCEENLSKDEVRPALDKFSQTLDGQDDIETDDFIEALFQEIKKSNCNTQLEEDSAGMVDDYDVEEDEDVCTWCGEKFPVSALKFEKNLGYICDRCQAAIASHEGDDALEF